nr:immunoglobulin light chain junction region [Macaca mulatta]
VYYCSSYAVSNTVLF